MGIRIALAVLAAAVVAAPTSGAASSPREILFVGVGIHGEDEGVLAIRPSGTGLRTLAAHGENPAWSPDGTTVVYGAYPNGLAVVPAGGGTPHFITSGRDGAPSWSPDGRWIAFQRGSPASLYVVRPDGSDLRKLLDRFDFSPTWLPDSRRLFVSTPSSLATVDLAGRVRLVPKGDRGFEATMSPNRRWIAFATLRRHQRGIAIEHPDGHGFRWLIRPHLGADADTPVWAPDSKRLAYVDYRQIDYFDHSEIRMISIAGRKLGSLRSASVWHDEYPQWSPDGREIVFDRDAAIEPNGEAVTLQVGDARSGRVRRLHSYIVRGSASWRPA